MAEAKARFSELVQKALSGEEVILARDYKPLLKLVPLKDLEGERSPGSARGQDQPAPRGIAWMRRADCSTRSPSPTSSWNS